MDKSDIPSLSATELSGLIERKEVSSVEATEAYLERIDDLDFKFHGYLTVCRKVAMEAVKEAEQAIVRGNFWDCQGRGQNVPLGRRNGGPPLR